MARSGSGSTGNKKQGSAAALAPVAPQQLALFDESHAPASAVGRASAPPPPPSFLDRLLQHGTGAPGQRRVRLEGLEVPYRLRRARRRTIGFTVGEQGLAVSAPRWVPLGEIDAALQAKGTWIVRKLQEQQERARRLEASRIVWRDGAVIPFLGADLSLVLDERVSGVVLAGADRPSCAQVPMQLHVGLPQGAGAGQLREAVQGWLQKQARRVFEQRCAHFAQLLGVTVRRLALSSAGTRWGSASADGSVRLNWRLIHFGMPIIDYVVAHELSHLREMNHSPAFWEIVRSVVPDFEARRHALRDATVPLMEI